MMAPVSTGAITTERNRKLRSSSFLVYRIGSIFRGRSQLEPYELHCRPLLAVSDLEAQAPRESQHRAVLREHIAFHALQPAAAGVADEGSQHAGGEPGSAPVVRQRDGELASFAVPFLDVAGAADDALIAVLARNRDHCPFAIRERPDAALGHGGRKLLERRHEAVIASHLR